MLGAIEVGEREARDDIAVLENCAGLTIDLKHRRRRTISKPSSALAGRHEDSTRPITLRKRSRASRPRMPPTSTSSACVYAANW